MRIYEALALSFFFTFAACSGHPEAEIRPPIDLRQFGERALRLAGDSTVRVEAAGAQGLGVVTDAGEVLTSALLVHKALSLQLVTPTGERVEASLRWVDLEHDLALLEPAKALEMRAIPLAPVAMLAPGNVVWAMGIGEQGLEQQEGTVVGHQEGRLQIQGIEGLGVAGPLLTLSAQGELFWAGFGNTIHGGYSASELLGGCLSEGCGTQPDALAWALVHGTSRPLSHQVVIAQEIGLGESGELVNPYHHIESQGLPVLHTLRVRTTWRYEFAGVHRYQYRVIYLGEEEDELVHMGPERQFELGTSDESFVHKVSIELQLEQAGVYFLVVYTDGSPSAFSPFALVVNADSAQTEAASEAVGRRGPFPSWRATTLIAAAQAGQDAQGQLSIAAPFNTLELSEEPLHFSSWFEVAWSKPGEHVLRMSLIDPEGRAQVSLEEAFHITQQHETHQHFARWEFQPKQEGRHLLAAWLDGELVRVYPIWAVHPTVEKP